MTLSIKALNLKLLVDEFRGIDISYKRYSGVAFLYDLTRRREEKTEREVPGF